MFSKNIDPQQREQYDYARGRIKQKKRLMQHFIIFLAGSILLIIINPILGIAQDFFIKDWFIWAILLWAFLFIVHLLNVFFMNRFMGKEWENRQLEKLKIKQEKKIAQLQQKIEKKLPIPEVKKNEENQTQTPEN
ncbi:MAG: heme/copper-type cytochrome/quinol oxidase subunit 4 [Flavobacteriaceae bacterium]|jgi:heme/copper-type cytochrome/quinol oxidase subunit 4|uniref:2TM domain-containing protein n=1 Tax=Candidatus Marifrigoribacter sp. Uisw_064 TaxID=3230970 RepID=UPI003AEB6AFA